MHKSPPLDESDVHVPFEWSDFQFRLDELEMAIRDSRPLFREDGMRLWVGPARKAVKHEFAVARGESVESSRRQLERTEMLKLCFCAGFIAIDHTPIPLDKNSWFALRSSASLS